MHHHKDCTPTPHIEAKKGDFADTVIMPGDPLRAKFIAEAYLENAVLVNNVRGICGYTGYYKGKRVSVMASGMGQPSIGIYSYELFNFYDVKSIIRVGTCGSMHKDLHARDIIIAMGACTNGSFAAQYRLPGTFCPIADFDLVRRAAAIAEEKGLTYKVGNMLSSDTFYDDANSALEWAKMGVLGVEMESAALYCNAARAGKKALCICTVSDSFIYPEENTTSAERQSSFTKMMEIALEIA
ncbi:MAG: purine-nucleoside phosphorylase [Clostridiales bacterium]|nr:purine-nucleoside phosphorylase [Clostridiales bacterium]